MRAFGAMVLLMAAIVGVAAAHQPDTTVRAAPAVAADSTSDGASTASPAEKGKPPPYQMPPMMEAAADHLHNKFVHFPIVLTLVAAAVLIVARAKPELEPAAFWLVWAAALSVIPAYFSGQAQQEVFEGKPKEWLVEVHRKQGITIGVVQALWVLSLLRQKTRRFAWIIGIVLAVLVLAAGFLGGLLAHGH